jgi:hypothetical protein
MQVELGLLTFHVVTRHFTVLGVCVGVLRDVTVLEHVLEQLREAIADGFTVRGTGCLAVSQYASRVRYLR